MLFLPDKCLEEYKNACNEKVYSYQIIAKLGLPVLKSIILSNLEVEKLDDRDEDLLKEHLCNSSGMIRYLYNNAYCNVKNGGKIVEISRDTLLRERDEMADLWIMEPCKREENKFCCNACINREIGNLHMEFVGEGFDISDINKGKIRSHEQMDIPYPISYGYYGEWWKWARIHFCSNEEYQESVYIRKNRLKELGDEYGQAFAQYFKAVDIAAIECIFEWIDKLENSWVEKPNFYNLSCSFLKSGRKICWDIQTPKGKLNAYLT